MAPPTSGQVQHMVRALLDLPEVPRPDDAADALAIAICHTTLAECSAPPEVPRDRLPASIVSHLAPGEVILEVGGVGMPSRSHCR